MSNLVRRISNLENVTRMAKRYAVSRFPDEAHRERFTDRFGSEDHNLTSEEWAAWCQDLMEMAVKE